MPGSADVTCPKCHSSFALTEAMSTQIKQEFEARYAAKEAELGGRLEEELGEQARKLEAQFSSKLRAETSRAASSAVAESVLELTDLKERLSSQETRLRESQAKEVELRRAQREVEDSKRDLELTLSRKLDEERTKIREEVGSQLSEEHSMKSLEWEKKRNDMEKLIEELKRKSEQGSTQGQGEAFELEVEAVLKEAFVHDSVEPVGKGIRGSDVLQRVQTRTGQVAGTISWELKNTKAWSDGWVPKLKEDMRAAKADVAVIISRVLPEGVKRIGSVDGVWVVDPPSFLGLALALRQSLLEVHHARQAAVGKDAKMELLFSYLSGPEFRGRIEAIVEAYTVMREDLEAEKKAFERIWAKREKSLTRATNNTAGIYGDLSGLIGSSLQEIPALALEVK